MSLLKPFQRGMTLSRFGKVLDDMEKSLILIESESGILKEENFIETGDE